MMEFAEMLRKLAAEKGISVIELSRRSGINHSTLYKIIHGTRKPSSARLVRKLALCMNCDEQERTDLLRSYYLTVLGPDRYYGARQITELIRTLSTVRYADGGQDDMDISVRKIGRNIFHGQQEISHAIYWLCLQAHEKKESSIEIFTSQKKSMPVTMLMHIMRQIPDTAFNHLAVLDSSTRVSADGRIYNLDYMKDVLPLVFSYPNYHAFNLFTDVRTVGIFDMMLSEMVITQDYILVCDADMQQGILIEDPDEREVYREVYHKLMSKAHSSITSLNPRELFQQYAAPFGRLDENCYLLSPGICIVLALENDETYSAKHLRIPEPMRSELIGQFHQYLPKQKAFLTESRQYMHLVSTLQGIEYFVQTGYVNEVSPDLMTPLTPSERLAVLTAWERLYDEQACILIDMPALNRDCHLWMYICRNSTLIQTAFQIEPSQMAVIADPGINALFYWYSGFICQEFQVERERAKAFFADARRKLALPDQQETKE